jgi:hypothetical protein
MGDAGATSTFVLVRVDPEWVTWETRRDDANGGAYALTDIGILR